MWLLIHASRESNVKTLMFIAASRENVFVPKIHLLMMVKAVFPAFCLPIGIMILNSARNVLKILLMILSLSLVRVALQINLFSKTINVIPALKILSLRNQNRFVFPLKNIVSLIMSSMLKIFHVSVLKISLMKTERNV